MKSLFRIVPLALTCHVTVAGTPEKMTSAMKAISASQAGVRWDGSTFVEGDFNGDGTQDFAVVGYKEQGIVLAVRASSGRGRTYRNDFQPFGIGPSIQAAICEAPAKLEVHEQFCNPMDEPLPGCRASKAAKSLNLSGGDCDSIHLFWNHKTNRMEWWRL
ncbi:MAG: hypothetical protein CFE43_21405 [Burkholderiales bacterium PBB3]|nr:MAG: hypothetical protein CFE43_21405 [Burkholderiales bacterium PBB3]